MGMSAPLSRGACASLAHGTGHPGSSVGMGVSVLGPGPQEGVSAGVVLNNPALLDGSGGAGGESLGNLLVRAGRLGTEAALRTPVECSPGALLISAVARQSHTTAHLLSDMPSPQAGTWYQKAQSVYSL